MTDKEPWFTPGDSSAWQMEAHERGSEARRFRRDIERMIAREGTMDEEGVESPAPEVLQSALELLAHIIRDSPELALPVRVLPSPTGSVVIEWHLNGLYLEAEVAEPGVAEWMFEESRGNYRHFETRWKSKRREFFAEATESASDFAGLSWYGAGAFDSASYELAA